MTTFINNQEPRRDNQDATSSGLGVIIGAIIVVLVLIAVITLAWPYVRQRLNPAPISTTNSTENSTFNLEVTNPITPSATTTVE